MTTENKNTATTEVLKNNEIPEVELKDDQHPRYLEGGREN